MVQHDQINVYAGAEELIHELAVDRIRRLPERYGLYPNGDIVVAPGLPPPLAGAVPVSPPNASRKALVSWRSLQEELDVHCVSPSPVPLSG